MSRALNEPQSEGLMRSPLLFLAKPGTTSYRTRTGRPLGSLRVSW